MQGKFFDQFLEPFISFKTNPEWNLSKNALKNKFKDRSAWLSFTKDIYQQGLRNPEKLRSRGKDDFLGFLRNLFGPSKNLNYLLLNWKISMGNQRFEILSQGQRKLLLLKIFLAFSNSDFPVLIDQPESDLDNRAIFDSLVTFLKDKKRTRQIIAVTHNPNIVIGADSENVIVTHQEMSENGTPKFFYISGSLEDSFFVENEKNVLDRMGIREHSCAILEGGKRAFENRRSKYKALKGAN